MKNKITEPIDFVITWVDGADSEWQKEKAKYDKKATGDKRENRYRDWGLLKYWFRAVGLYAPWVNKIHFVTCGQKPEWLDENNPKLHIVNHSDFMPKEILPTFNSVPIELYLHKIPGLTENFVYFNDDMFLNAPVRPDFFFKNNLPCDTAVLSAITPSDGSDGFSHCLLANSELIDRDYDIHKQIAKNFTKWFSLKYSGEQIRTMLLLPWHNLTGIKMHHMPISYKKSTYVKMWERHKKQLKNAAEDRFRNNSKINHWVFRYEQLITGKFSARNPKKGSFFLLRTSEDVKKITRTIKTQKVSLICINDGISFGMEFREYRNSIIAAFETKLNNKSSFEK